MADIVSDLGVNLLEEEIDEVIFQTNQFLTDATFTGSQGPFWWFLLAEFWDCLEPNVNQLLAAICSAFPKTDGTKTGQKSDLSIQRAACPDALFRLPLHPTPTKIQNCPVLTKNTGGNLLSSSPKNHQSSGSEYRERYSKSGTLILRAKKVEKFLNFFFDGKPSSRVAIRPYVHCTRRRCLFCRPFCHDPSAGIVQPASLSRPQSHRTIRPDSLSGCRVSGCSIGHPFCRQGTVGFAMPTPLDCRQK